MKKFINNIHIIHTNMKTLTDSLKNIKIILLICSLVLSSLLLFPNLSSADYTYVIRKRCNVFPKYNLAAWGARIDYQLNFSNWFPFIYLQKVGSEATARFDHGCSYAECNPVIDARSILDVRIGSSPHIIHNSGWVRTGLLTWSYYYGGKSFIPPNTINDTNVNINAKSSATLNTDATITGVSLNTANVTLDNFVNSLSATIGDPLVGSSFQVIIWKADSESDSILTSAKVLNSGSVMLQRDTVKTSGLFASSDFICTDSIGLKYCKPINGLSKSITISSLNDSGNTLRVSISSSAGIGTYDSLAIFMNDIMVEYINFNIEGLYHGENSTPDTVTVNLRSSISPYPVVASAINIVEGYGFIQCNFGNAPTGKYYLQILHRNSIETWSRSGGDSLFRGSVGFYNFSYASSQAYGNNMKQVDDSPVRYAIYSGDVNQDGLVDIGDVVDIYNDASSFAQGYLVSDLNGDYAVDLSDLVIANSNAVNFVAVHKP